MRRMLDSGNGRVPKVKIHHDDTQNFFLNDNEWGLLYNVSRRHLLPREVEKVSGHLKSSCGMTLSFLGGVFP